MGVCFAYKKQSNLNIFQVISMDKRSKNYLVLNTTNMRTDQFQPAWAVGCFMWPPKIKIPSCLAVRKFEFVYGHKNRLYKISRKLVHK